MIFESPFNRRSAAPSANSFKVATVNDASLQSAATNVFKAPTSSVKNATSSSLASQSLRRNSKSDFSSLTPLPSLLKKTTDDSPSSTPNALRKNKRRSHIFPNLTGNKKSEKEEKKKDETLGSGRAIPIQQGYLFKKSVKTLNKDWKKKYVTLTNGGTLTSYPSLHDCMNNTHGREIPLKHTTVKILGSKFKVRQSISSAAQASTVLSSIASSLNTNNSTPHECHNHDHINVLKLKGGPKKMTRLKRRSIIVVQSRTLVGTRKMIFRMAPNSQSYLSRTKNGDSKPSRELCAILGFRQLKIKSSLQGMDSDKTKNALTFYTPVDKTIVEEIKLEPGNEHCSARLGISQLGDIDLEWKDDFFEDSSK